MKKLQKIGLGGGCHWCTEAVFEHLKGVEKVEQGWIASTKKNNAFSEAIIVHFNQEIIALKTLIEIHLHTHKSTSNHSMRKKYRSAIYTFYKEQQAHSQLIINNLQLSFDNQLITQILPFKAFKINTENFWSYYKQNPEKPFCQTYINPKLQILLNEFSKNVKKEALKHLQQ